MENHDPCILFGKTVRWYREQQEISQESLADLADLDRTYISSIERGKRNVSIKNIYKLAEALKQPPYKLLQLDEAMKLELK